MFKGRPCGRPLLLRGAEAILCFARSAVAPRANAERRRLGAAIQGRSGAAEAPDCAERRGLPGPLQIRHFNRSAESSANRRLRPQKAIE
jgi:hypothetical protein